MVDRVHRVADIVGGAVTNAAYDIAANQYRPSDPAAIAFEVRRMHQSGLTARDISTALRLAPDVVITILYGEKSNVSSSGKSESTDGDRTV